MFFITFGLFVTLLSNMVIEGKPVFLYKTSGKIMIQNVKDGKEVNSFILRETYSNAIAMTSTSDAHQGAKKTFLLKNCRNTLKLVKKQQKTYNNLTCFKAKRNPTILIDKEHHLKRKGT